MVDGPARRAGRSLLQLDSDDGCVDGGRRRSSMAADRRRRSAGPSASSASRRTTRHGDGVTTRVAGGPRSRTRQPTPALGPRRGALWTVTAIAGRLSLDPPIARGGPALTEIKTRRAVLEPVHGLADLLEAGMRADRLGYDTLWTWDHLYPIVGSHEGPIFEGWLTLAAWAQATERIRIGLMVGANTFREPALTAKMATTLDHISNGRAILGIGGAWFETEHEALRARVRRRLPGAPALARRGAADHARDAPRRAPDGDRTALRGEGRPQRPAADPGAAAAAHRRRRRAGHAQARRAVRRREQRRRRLREREAQGGDPRSSTARRSGATRPRSSGRAGIGRSSSATRAPRRERVQREMFERNGGAEPWKDQPVGTPEDVAERIAPFLEHRLPPPHRRVPVAVRRGVDDPPRDRGPAAPRARWPDAPQRPACKALATTCVQCA